MIGSASKVPVFFWGKHCQPDLLPSVSALSSLSTDDFEAKYLNYFAEEKTLIAFIQDTLSLEDVAQRPSPYPHLEMHLQKEPSLILSSVESPVTSLEKLTPTVVHSIDLDEKSLSRILKEDKPSVLLIQLPQTTNALDRKEALQANDVAMERILKMLVDTSSNLLLTARNPSWNSKEEAESHIRMSRHLQAADAGNETNFVNVSSLLYLYTDKVTLLPNGTGTNITYPMPPTNVNHTFMNTSSLTNTSLSVDFEFTASDNPADKLILHLDIQLSGGKWWYVSSGQLSREGPEELSVNLLTSDVGASRGFSYSCGSTWLRAINSSANIRFDRFQLEFLPKRDRFSESFSCSTFFTIPMWMGLIVIILFTVILASGIYLLFEVKTMDRFDDPKGKSITVPLTD